MFKSIGHELPMTTRWAVAIGDPWVTLVPLLLVIVMALALVKLPGNRSKPLVAAALALSVVVYLHFLVSAILTPILELQKQLN